MLKKYYWALLIASLLFPLVLMSQTNEEVYFQAEDFVEDGNFHKALELYQSLLSKAPNNANLNFKVGFCYLNTAVNKANSIPYLEFASKHISESYNPLNYQEQNAPLEVLFYMGKAYHVTYRIDDAERTFFELKGMLTDEDEAFMARINHELASCQVARVLMKSPVEMKVSNLGSQVNSAYAEHSPVISGDESLLIFTSKREGNTGNLMMDDGQYFEDIYLSSFNGSEYTPSQRISGNVNTAGHEASVGLSFDGTKLFIYRDDAGDGNLYVSNRKGAVWDAPERLPDVVNSKFRETHASMSFDQNQLFFTSDRKGGYGGLDIYRVRKLPNGNWSKAQNLGPTINTPFDEEGPYIHPDGTSLFFASRGHNTMGGFDVFVSYIDDKEQWSTPQNLGYPINTPDDNVYYVPSVDGRRAYYASYANNSIGNYDIFRIDLSESHIRNQTVIAGFARGLDGRILENAVITLTDLDDNLFGIYTPDAESGKFLFILPRGQQFKVIFESKSQEAFEYVINVPEYAYDQSQQVVAFTNIVSPLTKAPDTYASIPNSDQSKLQGIDTDNDGINASQVNDSTIAANQSDASNKSLHTAELLIASELNKRLVFNENENLAQSPTKGNSKNNDQTLNQKSKNKKSLLGSQNQNLTNNLSDSSASKWWWWFLILPLLLFGLYKVIRKN
ncbi:MAG: hypothetical protein CVU09_10415 [Bacteroidetes bacterium HGW-Bacteroidetes-4]|jgi:hypothetical protein|nr:MAG: hypothetical protein CVU09_10415 [Bacteroidetes bacterium HGW-Bacteroidetes-4]